PLLIYKFKIMEKILMISQMIISALLIFIVLVQGKDEGFTASGGGQSFQATRRGSEKVIFRATIVLVALFLINALLFVFV
ncbi:MAG: preprotein translocase subunit SecG, partial [Kiritimatiellae bacterium]|nr:preprotein translocase subunit SecG [Kiritimatiellia bacterium]